MPSKTDAELASFIGQFWDDPLGFVMAAFPWGEAGTPLERETGPDAWQIEALKEIGRQVRVNGFDGLNQADPIRVAVASGHSVGKSAFSAWIHWWIMATRPDAKGRVTANTRTQAETITWAEIQKWHGLLICKHWFGINESQAWRVGKETTWFSVLVTCDPKNYEAFAGQHNRNSTSFYIFDEASLIADVIWDTADGGLLDGEPMMFAFGNPTRNTGKFYDVCFGKSMHRWTSRRIDSRSCKLANKREIQKWIDDYGEDSDYVRIRVKGEAPRVAESQFIGDNLVDGAQQRKAFPLESDALIAGVDVPDGGSASFVIRFRRGLDARPTHPADPSRRRTMVPATIKRMGSKVDRDTMATICAQTLRDDRPGYKVDHMFIDSAFGAAIYVHLKLLGFTNVTEVRFGGDSPDREYANMRSWMYGQAQAWLEHGSIDPADKELADDLKSPGWHRRLGGDGAIVLESKSDMKKRGILDVDDADALALTFARPVVKDSGDPDEQDEEFLMSGTGSGDRSDNWMGF